MGFLLELVRIILFIFVLGGFLWVLINGTYHILGLNIKNNPYGWLEWIVILIVIFIFYRNHLQFTGWYQKTRMEKLPKNLSIILLLLALIVLALLPFLDKILYK